MPVQNIRWVKIGPHHPLKFYPSHECLGLCCSYILVAKVLWVCSSGVLVSRKNLSSIKFPFFNNRMKKNFNGSLLKWVLREFTKNLIFPHPIILYNLYDAFFDKNHDSNQVFKIKKSSILIKNLRVHYHSFS